MLTLHYASFRITSIQYQASKTAIIHFEKASAAKTALMLNGGTLDGLQLNVTSETVHPDVPEKHDEHESAEAVPIEQSDKPRAGSMYHDLFS